MGFSEIQWELVGFSEIQWDSVRFSGIYVSEVQGDSKLMKFVPFSVYYSGLQVLGANETSEPLCIFKITEYVYFTFIHSS